jgi:ATPase family AAA domain-containing protein 3A/B
MVCRHLVAALWIAVTVFAVVSRAAFQIATESNYSGSPALYTEIQPVNRSDSYVRVRSLPIVYYKFLYDSVPDRVQLGVVGGEAQRLFPESIEVLPSTAFATPVNASAKSTTRSNAPTIVTNFPVVDKNVLFMHGLATVQELILRFEQLNHTIFSLHDRDSELRDEYQKLQTKLNEEITSQLKEKLELLQREKELVKKQEAKESLREQLERAKVSAQLEEEKSLLEYEERLARERLAQQEEVTKQTLANQLRLERELAERKETMQRKTAETLESKKLQRNKELEAKRLDYEKEKIRAEVEAKAQQDRVNEEIAIRKIQMQSRLDTERMVQGIRSVSVQVSTIVKDVLSRPKQLAMIAGILLALITCYFLIREFSSMVRQFIQARIGKPTLVRETSYHWSLLPDFLLNLLSKERDLSSSMKALEQEFRDIILSEDDKARVMNLALATRNTKKSGAPYRHVLLHGPPGTGKTLIARRLAKSSGMDYAILSGGDVAPLGEDAVNQLHALFRWASRSRKGLLVFIDEAEAFLSSRSNNLGEGASDAHIRNALNALLYQTGTPSKNFMMVLATNRPEDLDAAILDRIDVSLQISLPEEPERVELIRLYMNVHIQSAVTASERKGIYKLLFGAGTGKKVAEECTSDHVVKSMAKRTSGFSGREISKLFISAQYAMFLAPQQTLTWSILEQTLDSKVDEHRVKSAGFQEMHFVEEKSVMSHEELQSTYSKESSVGVTRRGARSRASKSLL